MWGIAIALFLLGKAWVLRRSNGAALADKIAFVLLWPGMDWKAFIRRSALGLRLRSEARAEPPLSSERWSLVYPWFAKVIGFGKSGSFAAAVHKPSCPSTLIVRGMTNLTLGTALTWLVARHIPHGIAATWVCMVGFIWALHGGVFTLLTAFWRSRGRDVQPLMKAPLLAASVTEFWGQRWNHAFRDLSHDLLFKPTARRFGTKAAMVVVFLVSGLVHELVVTVPARGGYGGPTLYFALQAVGLLLECGCPLKSQLLWRVRTFAFVLLPLPIAFPTPFVMNVCQPFFTALGALP